VAVAVDGQDGWNQVRAGAFDLVVTDVDMPRMTGLDLVKAIRDHEPLRDVPVMIVSYRIGRGPGQRHEVARIST